MKPTRVDTGQSPQLAQAVTWGRGGGGYGWDHVQHWRKPHELRRCSTSGCFVYISFTQLCTSCHQPTVPLWD